MPFLGVDDILFLLASTTVLLWAKRAELIEAGVFTTAQLAGYDPKDAARRATEAASCHGGTPPLLMKGFDLTTEGRRGRSLCNASTTIPAPLPIESAPQPGATLSYMSRGDSPEASLVTESVHAQFRETSLIYQAPQVPHRHYNPNHRRAHVTSLATSSEDVIMGRITRYSVAEVQTLFVKMEREGLWESVIHVSYGIEQAEQQLRYLNAHNVQCAIRTLLSTSHPDAALVYYFRFAEDMLVSDEILVALFHTCRNDRELSLELCRTLEPFKAQWTPMVYACCLTTMAHCDYKQAMDLYHAYVESQRRKLQASQRTLQRVLAASSLLHEAGVVGHPAPARLHHLYHVIVPLVVAHEPDKADTYVEDMLQKEPESAPDVLLKCLAYEKGQSLSWTYLRARVDQERTCPPPEEVSQWVTSQSKNDSTMKNGSCDVAGLAIQLYRLRPSAMNMNTLLKLLSQHARPVDHSVSPSAKKSWAAHTPSVTLPLQPQRFGIGEYTSDFTKLLQEVPLPSDLDASVLARTVTEQHTSWFLATQFLTVMLHRKCFNVVPIIAHHLARQMQWLTVARSMAIYLSNQRTAMTAGEAKLCIESSVHAGRWPSAFFWVERAHSKGLILPPSTYDLVLASARHSSFESAARVITTMHQVGAPCSEQSVLHFIETAAHHGKVANAFRLLQQQGNVQWVP